MNRDDTVTLIKALAIILMVAGHSCLSGWCYNFVYMFHMPVFFIMSGYCFKDKYLDNPKEFVWRRIKGLWWPFFKWTCILVLLHNLLFEIHVYNEHLSFHGHSPSLYSIGEIVKKIGSAALKMQCNESLLGGFWFFKQLFLASLLSYCSLKYIRLKPLMGGAIASILACLLFYFNLSDPVLGIGGLTLCSCAFFLFGLYLRTHPSYYSKPYIITVGFIILLAGSFFWPTEMIKLNAIVTIPYIISAMGATVVLLYIFRSIGSLSNWKNILLFVGNNTLPVLIGHFASFKLLNLLVIAVYGLDIEYLGLFPTINANRIIENVGILGDGFYPPELLKYCYTLVGVAFPLLIVYTKNQIWVKLKNNSQ